MDEKITEKDELNEEDQIIFDDSGELSEIEGVNVSQVLGSSGEETQKTRAQLEEELADAPWDGKEESRGNVNYGAIDKNSSNGGYLKNTQNPNQSQSYNSAGSYSANEDSQQNFYDADNQRVQDPSQIGELRREDRSRLEINGLPRKRNFWRTDDSMSGHRKNENYE